MTIIFNYCGRSTIKENIPSFRRYIHRGKVSKFITLFGDPFNKSRFIKILNLK